jgi:hypothetical protein
MTQQAQPKPEDRRRNDRFTVLWSATMISNHLEFECVIVNVSITGAMLRVEDTTGAVKTLVLRSSRFTDLPAKVAWRRGKEIGIEFTGNTPEVERIIGELLP